jgi:hypothetical protein
MNSTIIVGQKFGSYTVNAHKGHSRFVAACPHERLTFYASELRQEPCCFRDGCRQAVIERALSELYEWPEGEVTIDTLPEGGAERK